MIKEITVRVLITMIIQMKAALVKMILIPIL